MRHNFIKDDLANLKLEVDKLDTDKLEKVLSGLSNSKKESRWVRCW